MTTADANKELVRRLYGGLMAGGDTAVADQFLADDYLDHDIPGVGEGGRQELVAAVLAVRASFPDIAPTLGPMLAEADFLDSWRGGGSRSPARGPRRLAEAGTGPPCRSGWGVRLDRPGARDGRAPVSRATHPRPIGNSGPVRRAAEIASCGRRRQ
jgi:hypothetical protein